MKALYVTTGFIALALGITGIFLPIIPTTPFLLLTAWLWFRGAPALYERLIAHPKLGPYIRDFYEEKSMTVGSKICSIILVWISIGASVLMLSGKMWLKLTLLLIALLVSIHILGFKTKK